MVKKTTAIKRCEKIDEYGIKSVAFLDRQYKIATTTTKNRVKKKTILFRLNIPHSDSNECYQLHCPHIFLTASLRRSPTVCVLCRILCGAWHCRLLNEFDHVPLQ